MAEPLTFSAALKLAQQSAPSLAARGADVDAARASAVAAGRLPDPKIRAGVENFPISGPPAGSFNRDSMTMTTLGVMQEMPNAAKLKAARVRADADIGVAQAGQAVEARDVRLNTALAWVDLYYAERKLTALDEVTKSIAPIRASAASQLTTGAIRPAQSLDADQLSAALDDRRADLTAEVAKARSELVRWTGDDTADVTGDPPEYAVDSTTLRASLDNNPTLNTYGAISRQADADVAMARADKRPDWGWDVTYQHRDGMYGDMVSAGVTLSLPLFSKSRQDPVIDARTQSATRARLDQDAAHRQLQAQLDADLADHVMHHDRYMRAQTTLVPLAQKKADLEMASYGAGTATLSDVLGAQLALAEARIDLLSREADVVRDGIRLTLTYGSNDQ
jgi:cobalt-zinc-cadmium efflux system outer membrane protein